MGYQQNGWIPGEAAEKAVTRSPTESGMWLQLPCCDQTVHPVVITHHEGSEMVVTAPREPHATWVQAPGEDVTVTLGWADAGGSFVLNARVRDSHDGGEWTLEVVDHGTYHHRRRHVRALSDAPVYLLDHRRDVTVPGAVVDLSESGMRCKFLEWLFEGDDDPFRLTMRLDSSLLVVTARPLWSGRVSFREVHIGFEFVDLHFSVIARLNSHIDRQLEANNCD